MVDEVTQHVERLRAQAHFLCAPKQHRAFRVERELAESVVTVSGLHAGHDSLRAGPANNFAHLSQKFRRILVTFPRREDQSCRVAGRCLPDVDDK